MNLTFPLPSLKNPSASSSASGVSLLASALVRRLAISTCLVEMVMPVTVQPSCEAR